MPMAINVREIKTVIKTKQPRATSHWHRRRQKQRNKNKAYNNLKVKENLKRKQSRVIDTDEDKQQIKEQKTHHNKETW